MLLQINFRSGMPVYLQVVDQIKAAAAAGALRVGEALPSIRPLAEELRVNRNTIAKAYNELASQGVIESDGLTYAYGQAEAVHDFSLSVQPGRCYGLFGRNGAGKTTTMKCLLNLLRPRGGTVRLFGINSGKKEVEVKRRLAYVPDYVA